MTRKKTKRPLFGRGPELEYLTERIQAKGLTTIVGRPGSGKTRLLETFRDNLTLTDNTLVGYAESGDLLLRSLKDLYKRWLPTASFRKQTGVVWNQHKKVLVTRFGKTLGGALGKFLEATTPANVVGKLVDDLFDGLHKANRDLVSSPVTLPPLDYDQARDLLNLLDSLQDGDTRFILILDAFEQKKAVEEEANTLARFLTHLSEWPHCHVLLAAREPDAGSKEGKALQCARNLEEASAAAKVWPIPPLLLDQGEMDHLREYLNDTVPATKGVREDQFRRMIDSYAGVIGRWVEAQGVPQEKPQDEGDLDRLARDAHAYRYRELKKVLAELKRTDKPALLFAIRVALLPEFRSQEDLEPLDLLLLGDLLQSPLARLQSEGLLILLADAPDIPSYGHRTRYDAARRLLCTDDLFLPYARAEAQSLAVALAAQITSVETQTRPFAEALLQLGGVASALRLPDAYRGLCLLAASLLKTFASRTQTSATDKLLATAAAMANENAGLAPLMAMGLVNTIGGVREEKRQDELLELLKTLAGAKPDDDKIQAQLVMGLVSTIRNTNDGQRRDKLLAEFESLVGAEPGNDEIRFCVNASCPTCMPIEVEGHIAWRPTPIRNESFGPCWCGVCGEPMQVGCGECGSQKVVGSFCEACGTPYVHSLEDSMTDDTAQWVSKQQEQRREFLDTMFVSPANNRMGKRD